MADMICHKVYELLMSILNTDSLFLTPIIENEFDLKKDLKKALVKLHQFLKVAMKLDLKTTDLYLFSPVSPNY